MSQKFGNKKYVCWVLQLRALGQIKRKIKIVKRERERETKDTEGLRNINKEKRMRER